MSIVVAVYNVEPYVRRCLDSVLAQTFTGFECVIVDDGSPDGCPAICNEYAARDGRITVIHKARNGGLPQARKTGLENSRGEYALCLDGDDWIEPDMVELLYAKAAREDCDMVCCDIYEEYEPPLVTTFRSYADKISRLGYVFEWRMDAIVWNKLVKKEVYARVDFPTANGEEDKYIVLQLFYYADTIGHVGKPLNHYRINPNSLDRAPGRKAQKVMDAYDNFLLCLRFLEERYGADLSAFEPALSVRINAIKYDFLSDKKLRGSRDLSKLYPPSARHIFDKRYKKNILKKLELWLVVAANAPYGVTAALKTAKQIAKFVLGVFKGGKKSP